MPQETLQWRLPTEWLRRMYIAWPETFRLRQYQSFQTLYCRCDCDGVLPSIDEAERLVSVFRRPWFTLSTVLVSVSTWQSRGLGSLLRSHFGAWSPRTTATQQSLAARHERSGSSRKVSTLAWSPGNDGQTIGISPLKYWSRKYHRKAQGQA
jgi:hypothetical protein